VTRAEIQRDIWKTETFVDFEQGLNFCIRYLRGILNDSAEQPRYIETLPRRGYRFVAAVEQPAGAAVVPGKTRLAVLPFSTVGPGDEDDYFAEGLTEEMITELSRIDPTRLGVIARRSALKFRDRAADVPQFARELQADYTLTGKIRRAGSRIRITTRLMDARDGTHLWADAYERGLSDVFDIQCEVARRVAAALSLELLPARHRGTQHHAAHEAYLKGRFEWNKLTLDGLRRSIEWYEQALAVDPKYALPYAGLADSYIQLGHSRAGYMPPRDAMPKAQDAASKALALDDRLSEAHASVAACRVWYDWDWKRAEASFRAALDLNPSNVTARVWYAVFLAYLNRLDEAETEAGHGVDMDPLSPLANTYLAAVVYFQGRYADALEHVNRTIERDAEYAWAHLWRGLALREMQRYEDAAAALEHAVQLAPASIAPRAHLGHALAVAGRRDEAMQLLQQLTQMADERYVCPCHMAMIYAGLGDRASAFACLDRAVADRSGALTLLNVEPVYRELRGDIRFRRIQQAVGLSAA
ncbi:MAG TPA: tetratricopeptide repeat protein, partial [Vicinamibacterales bacterium]|nr:tetratricopeptide repeat protein [Vicinamibacterales bacterium]